MRVRTNTLDALLLGGWALLFAYVSLVPFYYLQPVRLTLEPATLTAWKYLPLGFVGCLVGFALAAGWSRAARALRTVSPVFVASVAAYAGISLLSVAAGAEYQLVGLLKALYYGATGPLLPLLIVIQFAHRELVSRLVHWVVCVAAVVGLYGLAVNVSGSDPLWGETQGAHNPTYGGVDRAGSTLGNPVVAGSYLALCLPFALWACRSASAASRAGFYAVCAGLMALGLALSFSRGAWLAGAVACAVQLWLRGQAPSRSTVLRGHRRDWVIWALCGVLLLSVVADLLSVFASGRYRTRGALMWRQLGERVEQTVNWRETESFRMAQFGTTRRVLQAHPLLGVGFGNFTRLFDRYQKDSASPLSESSARVVTTDNMYLMVTCETGLLGLAAFLTMLAAIGWALLLGWRFVPPGHQRELLRASFGALSGFLANMVGWDAMNHPAVRITFWMLMGVSLASVRCAWVPAAVGGLTGQRVDGGGGPAGEVAVSCGPN